MDSGMGWTVGLEPSKVGQWDMSGMSLGVPVSRMGWTVGLEPSRVGHSGHV